MNTLDSETDRLIDTGHEQNRHHRLRYAGLISVGGLGMASLHIPHFIADVAEEVGLLALVTGAVLPFVLAVSIAVAGYRLWQSELRATQLRRVGIWSLVGMLSLAGVSGAFLLYGVLEGATLAHFDYLLLDFATTGAIGGILVGWYDTNNRWRAKQLRVFRQAVEHAGHNIYLTTPDGRIEYVNPKFEDQTGYDQEEAVGANPRFLKSGEHDEEFYEAMWETILDGEVWSSEIVNERKDGSRYHVDQTIAPVTDDDGKIEHFIAINNDITELKEYEAELRRQNEQLDQFASVVSHDLRNPLNVAMSRAELAQTDCDSEHIEPIRRALGRMEQLIDDVLTLARQGDSIDETETVALNAVSERAWRQVDAPEATLSIHGDQSIEADGSRLQQLLENLFRNAVDHGGPDVSVHVGECEDGFYVADDGEGFGTTDTETLFESGYTTADGGTGLGLSIVEQIADAHGWKVTATNGDRDGARFEITGVETQPESELTGAWT